MSWIEKLYRTYENNAPAIGDRNDEIPLWPVYHITQKAHINVVVGDKGEFIRASVVPKTDARTIIPATEKSAGRTGGYVPHPLCDKLQYVAADYSNFGGTKPSEYDEYSKNLEAWCSSPFSHSKVCAAFAYIRRRSLIKDLVEAKVLHIDINGSLLKKWDEKSDGKPDIFKVIQGEGGQIETFVRFSVEIPGDPQSDIYTDNTVWKSWVDYYKSVIHADRGLCYVTGEEKILAQNHPKKIRNDGDGAKLISSNDTSGYTFRGRFTTADEASGVGLEVTQKAHSALRWLIGRQSWRSDEGQAIVAWAVSGADIPDPFADTASLFFVFSKINNEPVSENTSDTAQDIGIRLSKLIAGYKATLGPTVDIVVMGLDSAVPGRMAIIFYRELTGSELLERVGTWHKECCWLQKFSDEKVFVGAPAPRDIAEAAYGKSLDGNKTLRKATVERLLPCIIDGVQVPRDIVESCIRRSSNRFGVKSYQWEKTLGIACALYRYQNKERNYIMALERDRKTRDYLYGRLLALAERIEECALRMGGETRATNAAKLMQRFAEHPYSTWRTIETSLAPYKARLKAKKPALLYAPEKELDTVVSSFSAEDFTSDRKLTGEFLLGYHCQREAPWNGSEQVENDHDSDTEE